MVGASLTVCSQASCIDQAICLSCNAACVPLLLILVSTQGRDNTPLCLAVWVDRLGDVSVGEMLVGWCVLDVGRVVCAGCWLGGVCWVLVGWCVLGVGRMVCAGCW